MSIYDKSVIAKKCKVLQKHVDELEIQVPKTILQLKKQAEKDKLEMMEQAVEDKLEMLSEVRAEMKSRDEAHSTELLARDIAHSAEMKRYHDEAIEHFKRVETMLFAMQTELGIKRNR